MENPWLDIPASEYEAHMSLPEVAQAQALSSLMAAALKQYEPDSVAVIGCSTGNGFEHIDIRRTRRVVGLDINPLYLEYLRARYEERIPGLELIDADVAAPGFRMAPVSMAFAGLIFEYVNVKQALSNIERSLNPGGLLLAVLQERSAEETPVTATKYESLARLAPIMRLVPTGEFSRACENLGLRAIKTDQMPLKRGKAFFIGLYQKECAGYGGDGRLGG